MCRILFKPNNTVLFNREILRESYQINPDGSGLIYYDESSHKMIAQKWMPGTDFEEIYRSIAEVESNVTAKNVAVHFRIGTSGGKGEEQIHPMHVKDQMYLLHNGICVDFEFDPEIMSDTQLIAFWFKCLDVSVLKMKDRLALKYLNEKFVGNKLIIIEGNDYVIVNEALGCWTNGIWQSWIEGYQSTIYDVCALHQDLDKFEQADEDEWERAEQKINPYYQE